MSDLFKNNDPMVRNLKICVFKNRSKSKPSFEIKVQEEGMGSLELEQHSQWRSSIAFGLMAKLQATYGGA